MMKQLQQMNEEINAFYENWQAFYQGVENPDQMELPLDDYAIPDEETDVQSISFESLQKHCAEKARAGYSEGIRSLIESYGKNKLSEISPEDYANLWKQVDALC